MSVPDRVRESRVSTTPVQQLFTARRALFIVLILGVSYSFNGMDRQVFPALLPGISEEYGLELWHGGLLSNIFAVNIALFGSVTGWLITRLGRKRVLVGGLAFYSIFTLVTPLARNFGELMVFRAMTGIGEALHIAVIFTIIGAFFGARRGIYMGINNAFFGLGAFLGPVVGTQLAAAYGSWHVPFYVYGVAGLVSVATLVLFVPKSFTTAQDQEIVVAAVGADVEPMRFLNRNSVCCLVGFALVGCSFFSYSSLYPSFLKAELGFSVAAAGAAFGMFGLGALSAVGLGWVGERLGKTGLMGALGLLAVTAVLMFHVVEAFWIQAALSLLFGALVSGYLYPRFIAVSQRSVAPDRIGYIMSLLLAVFYLPGIVAGALFGKLATAYGWGTAATVAVVAPAVVGVAVIALQRPTRMRGGQADLGALH
ncbi:MFS transporter [Pseudonocardia sp. RS010]|uniref:MFS transporter n=1 Tax=Pseudonocardia sp. RS010 TaxID=3385979 RepID=UPI0039A19EEB